MKPRKTPSRTENPSDADPSSLDAFDRRILSALRQDGRLTLAALSAEVGLSPSPCWTRLKRLEANGVVKGYAAILDHRALGVPDIAFVELTVENHDDKTLEAIGAALHAIPEILEAYLVTGSADYMIKVAVDGTGHFERFLREKLYRIPGIRHTRSTFALRAVKDVASVDPLALAARSAPRAQA